MKQFTLNDGTVIVLREQSSPQDALNDIATKVGNQCVEDFTMQDYYLYRILKNDGWELCPNFYGEKTESRGTALHSAFTWYRFNGVRQNHSAITKVFHDGKDCSIANYEIRSYVLCVKATTNELWLYKSGNDEPHLVAKFDCYYDLKDCLNDFDNYVPVKLAYDVNFKGEQFDPDAYEVNKGLFEALNDHCFQRLDGYVKTTWTVDKDRLEIYQQPECETLTNNPMLN